MNIGSTHKPKFNECRYITKSHIKFQLGEVLVASRGISPNPYLDVAVRQVNAILGDGGRSFMVGFGNNPPQRVQHAAA
jgi:hypothetical protein